MTQGHPSLLPAAAAPRAGASEADRMGLARRVRRHHGRHRQCHRLQPVSEGRHAVLHHRRRDAGRQQPRGNRPRAALRRRQAAADAGSGVVLHQPRPRQPQDLLQRDSATRAPATTATCSCKLKGYDTSETPRLLDELRQQLKHYPNARIYVKEFQNGPPITAPIAVRVIGPDLDQLYELAAQGREDHQGNAGHARRRESDAHAAHESAARCGLAEGGACSACRRSSSIARCVWPSPGSRRGASRIRRRAVRHRGAHADRRASRRTHARSGARVHSDRCDAAAQSAGARGVQLGADADSSLQPRTRRHHQLRSAERLQHRQGHRRSSGAPRPDGVAARLSLRAGRRTGNARAKASAACRPR